LRQVENRFSEELDIEQLLDKIRYSYDLLNNMVNRKHGEYLNYNKKRVVDESSATSEEYSFSSSDDEIDRNLNIRDQFKVSIIRGMSIPPDLRRQFIKEIRHKNSKQLWGKLGKKED